MSTPIRAPLVRHTPGGVYARLREAWELVRVRRKMARFARPQGPSGPHALPGRLVVSLTSYPARYRHLHRTLRSLLAQTVRADSLVLWLAQDDVAALPSAVTDLVRDGLSIRTCRDMRSYNKLIHALADDPAAFVATADDDLYYEPRWLETLTRGWNADDGCIVCHRAHRLTRAADGTLAPYADWEEDVQDDAARRPSVDLLPTGVGGVLYPPGALHPDVLDADAIGRLAPRADDLWFYWMARRAGTRHRKVGGRFVHILWPGTQATGLRNANLTGANDAQIANLKEAFGDPVDLGLLRPAGLHRERSEP